MGTFGQRRLNKNDVWSLAKTSQPRFWPQLVTTQALAGQLTNVWSRCLFILSEVFVSTSATAGRTGAACGCAALGRSLVHVGDAPSAMMPRWRNTVGLVKAVRWMGTA